MHQELRSFGTEKCDFTLKSNPRLFQSVIIKFCQKNTCVICITNSVFRDRKTRVFVLWLNLVNFTLISIPMLFQNVKIKLCRKNTCVICITNFGLSGPKSASHPFRMKFRDFQLKIEPKAFSMCNNHVLTKKRMCHMHHELRSSGTEKRESSFYDKI